MSLSNHRPRELTERHLLELITAAVPEGKVIDYKAELPGSGDSAKRDFVADLCSFANASGGHIVFGMEESEGLPTHLRGLVDDVDKAILRLESMARDSIRPPLPGLEFVRISLENGNHALVVAVPKSWNPPHQVIFQKDYRYYTRGSAGKQHLDVDELRQVVLQSQESGERIRDFRAARVAAVISGETPVPLQSGALQILHFVPLAAFGAGMIVDLNAALKDKGTLVSAMGRGGSVTHNVDGLLAHTHDEDGYGAYAQLFRNGILEAIRREPEWTSKRGYPVLASLAFEEELFRQTKGALATLTRAGVSPPIAIMLSFVGIKGWRMGVKDSWGTRGGMGFDRDPLLIPEQLLVEASDGIDVTQLLKPTIDATWNAAGFEKSDYYDSHGTWIGEAAVR
jgi:schlafen family protein